MKRRVLLVLLLLFVSSGYAQEAEESYIFFAPIRGQSAYLINREGRIVKEWQSDHEIFTALLLDNGQVLMGVDMRLPLGGWHILEAYDWEGNLLWAFDYPDMHHAFRPMPNGNILIPAWNRFTEEEMLAMGLNPALMTQPDVTTEGQDYDGMLLDKIIELDPSTMTVVWEWRVQDYLVQDYDESLPNYGAIAAAPERINLNLASLRLPSDRPHINALDYHAERDEILISAHFFSEIWVIDHAQESGLLYRWGNPAAYQRGTNSARQLYFQHDAQWLPNGNILIFNNGMPIFRPYSSLTEIEPPLGYPLGFDTAYEPTAPLWDADLGFHALNLGSVQRLANGHHLISDGNEARIFELDAEGTVVWDYISPVQLTPELEAPIFVARAFAADSPALAGRELRAGDSVPRLILTEAGD